MPIPRANTSWVWYIIRQTLPYEVVVSVATAVVGVIAARRYFKDGDVVPGWAVVVGLAVILLAGIGKAVVSFLGRSRSDSSHDLEGCLQTLHSVLVTAGNDGAKSGLRIALHVPIKKGKRLEQACNYITDDASRRRGAGRKFSVHCGAIGEALRTGNVVVTNRVVDEAEEYIRELVAKWHYSLEEARKLDLTVFSTMAVPLKTPGRPMEAIVYLDSQKRDFFAANRQDLVLHACTGIALFAGRRYN